jgi:phosphoribosyl-ATP pyrophosphohydrolase/phosphoribosyl-AMP cyclohydrolase
MINLDVKVNFEKYADGLVPAIIQDSETQKVLMLGFMNEYALTRTLMTGKVTFYSRTRERIWTKGEESMNYLLLKSIESDCDQDTLLIKAKPLGPVCHTGADTCWNEKNVSDNFLTTLEAVIEERSTASPDASYTAKMLAKGINKVAQKVGEEAVELVIEAKDNDKDLFLGEAADLMFHYLLLLKAKGYKLHDVIEVLESRHKK